MPHPYYAPISANQKPGIAVVDIEGDGDDDIYVTVRMGENLLSTCLVVEEISKKCPSTAMCFKMHLEVSEILNLLPTQYQVEQFVKPMARGEVFTTIAGGESWGSTPE